jgi:hypothetical protein
MHHPDFTQQLAGERQARYRAQAARSRLTRPDRSGDGRASSIGSDLRPVARSTATAGTSHSRGWQPCPPMIAPDPTS